MNRIFLHLYALSLLSTVLWCIQFLVSFTGTVVGLGIGLLLIVVNELFLGKVLGIAFIFVAIPHASCLRNALKTIND